SMSLSIRSLPDSTPSATSRSPFAASVSSTASLARLSTLIRPVASHTTHSPTRAAVNGHASRVPTGLITEPGRHDRGSARTPEPRDIGGTDVQQRPPSLRKGAGPESAPSQHGTEKGREPAMTHRVCHSGYHSPELRV